MHGSASCVLFLLIVVVIRIGINAAFVKPSLTNLTTTECQSKSDFDSMCVEKLRGIIDGPRCYFFVDQGKPYPQAWESCAQYNAPVARVQTQSEYTKISDLAKTTFGSGATVKTLLPFVVTTRTSKSCPISSNTYWYHNETTPNTELPVNNSWFGRIMSCRTNDGVRDGPPACVFMYSSIVADSGCSGGYTVLCEISNAAQTFQLAPNNTCLTETPIDELSTISTPRDCAVACGERRWCRSFNFFDGTGSSQSSGRCQFFTWSISDTTRTIQNDTTCHHYNYVA